MTTSEFIELAKSLRDVGVTRVEAGGFVAVFPMEEPSRIRTPAITKGEQDHKKNLTPYEALEAELAKDFA